MKKIILLLLLAACTQDEDMRGFIASLETAIEIPIQFNFALTNSDADKVEIVNINGNYSLFNLGGTANPDTNYFQNMILSEDTATVGYFEFVMGAIFGRSRTYQSCGLYVDNNNRIELYRSAVSPYNMTYRIIVGGSEIYSIDTGIKDFGRFKISVSEANLVSLYLWDGDVFNQIGTSQTASMGSKGIFASTCGGDVSTITLSDCSIGGQGADAILNATNIRGLGADMTGLTSNTSIINTALLSGDVLIDDGYCLIDSPILIPSNRTLYIRNARIKTDNAVYDNIFRNANPDTGNTNINVIGLGTAILDENSANNYSLDYAVYGGLHQIVNGTSTGTTVELYKANAFFLCNVSTYSVKNLMFADHKHYVSFVQNCSFGTYENLYFNHYTLTRNQDGIQVAYNSHDITFTGLRGYTGDDFVSIFLGTNRGGLFYPLPNFTTGDCYNITWDDMIIDSRYHGVIFITGDGNKIYNINFNNAKVYRTTNLTYFGSTTYNAVQPIAEEFKDITFDNVNVVANTDTYVMEFISSCKNITFTNFVNNSGKTDYTVISGTPENISINGTVVIP